MPDLIAQGQEPQDRWRRKLQAGVRHMIGRSVGAWSTPWDERISRRHFEVVYESGKLHVLALADSRNPVFYRGLKADKFSLRPGDHFVVGQTTFSLVDEQAHVSLDMPHPSDERTFTLEELRRQPFRQADRRIEVLSRLPDIISGSSNDQEMFVRLVNLLLNGIDRASAAAVVALQPAANPGSATSNQQFASVLHWDRRMLAATDFQPSERLIRQAVETGESVAFVWNSIQPRGEQPPAKTNFTVSEGVDWAFCVPLSGECSRGWALYVAGTFAGDLSASQEPKAETLRDDVKFAELTAATMTALRESRQLARRQASLSQFFSPVVLDALGSQDADEVLAPREADVTVLFCDLRGFTQHSERAAGSLFDLLERVSQALGVMTHHILEQGGVVGDFHGDAAMGFWGWPLPQADAVERACRAALNIRREFAKSSLTSEGSGGSRDYLADFRVGIGIASGRAVAGKIGTVDQVKVTVFGPVVNLASRLETMTDHLGASILIDPPTAAVIRATIPPAVCRVRRLAKVRPLGLAMPLEVSELVPPDADSPLTDEHLTAYEAALDAFQGRDWPAALKLLHRVPPDDQAKDFLTVFIAQNSRTPPTGWDGTISLEAK